MVKRKRRGSLFLTRKKRKRSYGTKRKRSGYRKRMSKKIKVARTIPKTMIVEMPWIAHVSESSVVREAIGSVSELVISSNGLWLPLANQKQPKGFDQWMLLYNRYRVLSYKVIVTVANESTSANEHGRVYVFHDTVSTDRLVDGPTMEDVIIRQERKRGKPKWRTFNAVIGGQGTTTTVHKSDKADRIAIWKEEQSNREGSVTANPVNEEYIHLGIIYPNRPSITADFFQVKIIYTVKLTQPFLLDLS